MREQSVYTTVRFKDKNTNELIHQLTLRNHSKTIESIKRTLQELTEKFCLPEQDILIENN